MQSASVKFVSSERQPGKTTVENRMPFPLHFRRPLSLRRGCQRTLPHRAVVFVAEKSMRTISEPSLCISPGVCFMHHARFSRIPPTTDASLALVPDLLTEPGNLTMKVLAIANHRQQHRIRRLKSVRLRNRSHIFHGAMPSFVNCRWPRIIGGSFNVERAARRFLTVVVR